MKIPTFIKYSVGLVLLDESLSNGMDSIRVIKSIFLSMSTPMAIGVGLFLGWVIVSLCLITIWSPFYFFIPAVEEAQQEDTKKKMWKRFLFGTVASFLAGIISRIIFVFLLLIF